MGQKKRVLQIYATNELCEMLEEKFGRGEISLNIERILREYLTDPAREKKIRLSEIYREIVRFNNDFGMNAELVFPEADKNIEKILSATIETKE